MHRAKLLLLTRHFRLYPPLYWQRGSRVVRQTHECFAVARVRHGELCAVLRRPPNFDKLRSGAQGGDLFDPAARERAKRVASGKEGTRLRKTWKSLQTDCDKLGGRIRKLSTAINEAVSMRCTLWRVCSKACLTTATALMISCPHTTPRRHLHDWPHTRMQTL